jgi:hypothetical protein
MTERPAPPHAGTDLSPARSPDPKADASMTTAQAAPSPALDAARAFAARGWRPFPLDHPSLPECIAPHRRRPCDGKRGKHPAGGWGTQTATEPTDAMLRLWFGGEARNVGIAAGPSGLLILDEDETDALAHAAAELGEKLPDTYRVLTSRGWHWYFTDPGGEFGNGAGALADYGIDVRGGQGAGGYVVAAGSLHASGVEYTAEDDRAEAVPIPEWIKGLLRATSAAKADPDREPNPDGWTDEPRYGYADDLRAQYERHLADVHALAPAPGQPPNGGQFRHALFLAALDGWRLADVALIDELTMLRQIKDAIAAVWSAEPDDDDRHIVYTEARDKATASPWRVLDPSDAPSDRSSGADGATDADGASETGTPTAEEIHARQVQAKLRELRVMEEARRLLARENRAHRPSIADGIVDDLDAIESPVMLMGSLIPEEGVGFLAGRSGAYKSFLAVAWGCSIATGRAWLGQAEFAVRRPLRTLYVAAEGAAGAAGRVRAWEAATGVSRRGKLVIHKRPIHLNDPDQVDELVEYVTEHGYRFVIIDTYHRAAPGTEENNSTEFGVVFAAAARLRDECGAGVLFVDHTGHGNEGRPRGTSAKGDDADYVLSAGYEGPSRGPEVQRTLSVIKLKDEESGASWPIRLAEVDGQHFPVVEVGALERTLSPFGEDVGEWWALDQAPEIPPEVAEQIAKACAKDRNRGVDAARWIWRYLKYVDDEDGLTRAQIERALARIPRERPLTESMIKKALPRLVEVGLIGRDRTRYWLE